jgi:hypothetical protein
MGGRWSQSAVVWLRIGLIEDKPRFGVAGSGPWSFISIAGTIPHDGRETLIIGPRSPARARREAEVELAVRIGGDPLAVSSRGELDQPRFCERRQIQGEGLRVGLDDRDTGGRLKPTSELTLAPRMHA